MFPKLRRALPALLLIAAAGAAAAQGADPIEIQADNAELDRAAQRSVYRGDVVLVRGRLELRGSELIVTRDEAGQITAVLTGSPARLHQAPSEESKAPIKGAARRMTYEAGREHVELSGDAMIERGGNTVRGDTIAYDMASGRTEARRADGDSGERVRITLDPPNEDEPEADNGS